MIASIPEIIEEIKQGKMIIMVDDEDRENEGDFIIASDKTTPEQINFMAMHGRGMICLSLTGERCEQLGLNLMIGNDQNNALHGTAFTVTIDAAEGTTTGISASDRATTVLAAVKPDAKPEDFNRPGHIFPLRAADGGVLKRAGHTEASSDLARLAGLAPSGVLCEILNEDGSMARLPQLEVVAERFGMKIATVRDLIQYRRQDEKLVERDVDVDLPTRYGKFRLIHFHNKVTHEHHLALVKGDVNTAEPVLVRVHSECLTGDVFGSDRCDCGDQLHQAMRMIEAAGRGVLLYMNQEGRGIGLTAKLHAYKLQDEGLDTVEANLKLGFPNDLRDYGTGALMLKNLGVQNIRLMTNNPKKIVALEGFGLKMVERVPIEMTPNATNLHYLETKRDKMGHLILNGNGSEKKE